MSPAAQRFASQSAALGRGRRSRPTRKMKRRVKLLGICAESPASGARFVGQTRWVQDLPLKRDNTAHLTEFYTHLYLWQPPKILQLFLACKSRKIDFIGGLISSGRLRTSKYLYSLCSSGLTITSSLKLRII